MHKIDILLATYNGEKYLKDQLSSLLNQSCQNFKIIARDDGSNDNTVKLLEMYKARYPDRFEIIYDEKKGLGPKDNFLELLKYSTADYIMFCDQDDIWLSHKVEVSLNKIIGIEENKPALVHTDLKVVDEKLNVIGESFWKYQNINPDIKKTNRLIVQNNVTGCTMIINKKLKNLIIGKKFSNSLMHDWVIAIVVSLFGRIEYIEDQTILYRQHGSNDTGAKRWGIGYVFNKLKGKSLKVIIKDTRKQCSDIVKNFKVPNEIETYTNLHELSYLSRKIHCMRFGFLKEGLLRNIVYLILV